MIYTHEEYHPADWPHPPTMVELSNGDSLGAALGSVGLKLERMKAPLDVIVVDKANKTPTSN